MSRTRRGIEIIRSEGVVQFIRSALQVIRNDIRNINVIIQYKISDGENQVTIKDAEATFLTTTFSEFKRSYDLMEEKRIISDLLGEIGDNDVFYDIGANIGLYTCLVGSSSISNIYSFEPHPNNVQSLRENVDKNNTNCRIFEIALSNENGIAELESEGTEPGLGNHSLGANRNELTVPVKVRELDKLRKTHDMSVPHPL